MANPRPQPRQHTVAFPSRRVAERGAALLVALLTVTLVATFAAAALWQQWRATEVESAERGRLQSAWVLMGALDWSRLILREDAIADSRYGSSAPSASGNVAGDGAGSGSNASPADHLGEPWAIALEEIQLQSFLSAEHNVAADQLDGLPEAFLSGRIVDAQSKMNARNLVSNGKPAPATVTAFQRLFSLLGLPTQQVLVLADNLSLAWPAKATAPSTGSGNATPKPQAGDETSRDTRAPQGNASPTESSQAEPSSDTNNGGSAQQGPAASTSLVPARLEDLVWFGLPLSTVEAIAPYVTVLPKATPININTASAEVLSASMEGLDMATAQRLITYRQRTHFGTIAQGNQVISNSAAQLTNGLHSTTTQYFEVEGRLRLDRLWVLEQSLIHRNGLHLQVLRRSRGAGMIAPTPTS